MKRKAEIFFTILAAVCSLGACGRPQEEAATAAPTENISQELEWTGSMELDYADQFSVDYYEDGWALITVAEDARYLVVPEGKEAPQDLNQEIVILRQPVDNIYLSASAVMDMFAAMDALDSVRFSALDADGWYIEPARQAMEEGQILYAGKYSAPDYEKILEGGCGLAIENTMIYHSPEVKEQLEHLGIPVLVDYSSYEDHPLGRTEWVKLYGLLTGHEREAEAAFEEQKKLFEEVETGQPLGKTVAFFYITSAGEASVRRPSDYLAKMIEIAGGEYVFEQAQGEESKSSTMTMEMEEFYSQARDADYMIYNSTIDGEIASIQDLTAKSPLLENFKAVRQGNVYGTRKNLYQSTMELGTIVSDIHGMLTGDDENLTYLYKVEQ